MVKSSLKYHFFYSVNIPFANQERLGNLKPQNDTGFIDIKLRVTIRKKKRKNRCNIYQVFSDKNHFSLCKLVLFLFSFFIFFSFSILFLLHVDLSFFLPFFLSFFISSLPSQLDLEYIYCIPFKGLRHPLKGHLGYDTKLHLTLSLQFGELRNVEYAFIAITSRSTLIQSGRTS